MTALERLPADVLAHLAHTARDKERFHVGDPETCADQLGELVANGHNPTLGFWRRHIRPRPPPTNLAPPCPPPAPWQPYTPAELANAACDLADAHIPYQAAAEALADIARQSHLPIATLADCLGELGPP